MTWQEHDTDPLQVAAEQYRWWREKGFTITDMMQALGKSNGELRTGDDVIPWLAEIWDSEVLK